MVRGLVPYKIRGYRWKSRHPTGRNSTIGTGDAVICKQQVKGSSPLAGSMKSRGAEPKGGGRERHARGPRVAATTIHTCVRLKISRSRCGLLGREGDLEAELAQL